MLGVIATIWLLLQLPVALSLGHFIACPQRRAALHRRAQGRPQGASRPRAA